jgi:SAM-dependent methyltransferase
MFVSRSKTNAYASEQALQGNRNGGQNSSLVCEEHSKGHRGISEPCRSALQGNSCPQPDSRSCPSPSYLSIELAKLGQFEIVGLDISKSFAEIAKENARTESINVDFRQGNASAMPFAEDSFDLIVCRAAFKNFSEPVSTLNEMFLTLKAGGRAIIIDLSKDVSCKEVAAYVDKMDRDWLDLLLTKLIFRFILVPSAYSKGQFRQMVSSSRFERCEITESLISLEVILKK